MKILFIRYKKSKNILEGGEQCSGKNYNELCSLVGEENVHTYYIHDETRKRSPWEYVSGAWYFPRNYYFGLTPKRVRAICAMAQDYDMVWVDRSLFGIVAKQLKDSGYKGRVVGFFHNVETMYFDAKLKSSMPLRKVILRCAGANDGYICRYADRIVALNQRDDAELRRLYGRGADVLVPIAFADNYQRESYPAQLTDPRPLCLIVGSFFPANVEGIEWFVKQVYPHVDIRLRIVGKGMERLRDYDWFTPDIELVANAPELLPHFEAADMMVLPIFKGGGMKVKTCESLMYGKNILGTDEAWIGYDIDAQQAGGRCNTAEEFISRIQQIQQNPIPRFNSYSRQVFLEKYSEEAVRNLFAQVVGD